MAHRNSSESSTTLNSFKDDDGLEMDRLNRAQEDRDNEDDTLLQGQEHEPKAPLDQAKDTASSNRQAILWMCINVVATVLIVSNLL
jgi:hypothetical protein